MLEIYVNGVSDVVELNDYFFNKNTYQRVLRDKVLQDTLQTVEKVKFCGEYIISKITNEPVGLSHISTGCKTLLNIIAFPSKVFSIVECGENILLEIFKLKDGKIYCKEKLLPFEDIENSYRLFYGSSKFEFNTLSELEGWWDSYDSQADSCK